MSKLDKQISLLRDMLPRCGFTEDAYGHFQKDWQIVHSVTQEKVSGKTRVKIQRISVLVERKFDRPRAEWQKMSSAYLKDVVFTSDSVMIGKRVFKTIDSIATEC